MHGQTHIKFKNRLFTLYVTRLYISCVVVVLRSVYISNLL